MAARIPVSIAFVLAAAGPAFAQPEPAATPEPAAAPAPEAADSSFNLEFAVGLDCIGAPESDAAQRAIAAYWFEQGLAQVDRQAYADALRSFSCSYAFIPHAATLYNLAHAADWAGEPETALQAYRLYLEQVPEAENRAAIETDVLRLVTVVESGTAVVATTPVPPGQLMGRPEDRGSVAQQVAGWSCIAVGAGGAVVGSVFAGLAARERSAIETAPLGTPWATVSDNESRAWDYDVLTAVGFGVAGAAALTGILLLALDGDDEDDGSSFAVAPAFGDGATGLVIGGVF